jgi:hypothetical protein
MFVASHAARLLDLLDYLLRSEFEYHLQMPYDAKRSHYLYQKICPLKQKAVVVV